MKKHILSFLLINILLLACSASKNANIETSNSTEKTLDNISVNIFNSKGFQYFNANKGFILVTNKEQKKNSPVPTLKFFIFNVANSSVIFKETIFNGNVFWKDDKTIEVIVYPEIVMKHPSEFSIGYLLNVETLEKSSRIKN